MPEVSKVATPLDEDGIIDALIKGHRIELNADPTQERLACAWAQIALEHARGKAVWNNNLGNITAQPSYVGDFYVIVCKEQLHPGVWKPISMHFRAHDSIDCGAADYWHLMASRYQSALDMFDRGDAGGAALELGRLHYFTASADKYAVAMRSLAAEFLMKHQ